MKEYAAKEKRQAQRKAKPEETASAEGLSYMPPALQLSAELPDHPLAPSPRSLEEQTTKPFQPKKAHLNTTAREKAQPFDFTPYNKAKTAQHKVEPFSFKKKYGAYEKPAQQKIEPFSFKKQYGEYEKPAQRKVEPFDFSPYQTKREKPTVEPYRYKPTGAMPEAVQAKMENSLGHDFSDVNIHKESQQATDVGALAFAQGNDVHFAPGQFKPDTKSGQELLGHELTHVVQQREGRVQATSQAKGLPVNDDPALEKEADERGKKAAEGSDGPPADSNPTAPSTGGSIQRKCTDCASKKKHNSHSQAGHRVSDSKLEGGNCPSCGKDFIQEKSAEKADKKTTIKHKSYLGRGPPAQHKSRLAQQNSSKHPKQAKAPASGNRNFLQQKSNAFASGTGDCLAKQALPSSAKDTKPLSASPEVAKAKGVTAQHKKSRKPRDDCASCKKKPIQRSEAPMQFGFGDFIGDAWDGATGVAGDVWDATGGAAIDAVMEGASAIVRRLAPSLHSLISDPLGTIRESVESGIGGWLSGIFSIGGIGETVANFQTQIGDAFAFFEAASAGDATACATFSAAIDSISSFIDSVKESPVVEALGSAMSSVNSVFSTVTDFIIAPAFDAISSIVGEAFTTITSIATDIWEWGAPVRSFLGSAWDWVLEQLGIAVSGASGIMDWVMGKMDDIWQEIKATFEPVIEPIQTVATVLVALSPAGPILAAIQYGPEIMEVLTWLWDNKDNPDIIEAAHAEMGHTILPKILTGANNISTTIESGINSFIEQVTAIGTGITSFIESITGIPIIGLLRTAVTTISEHVQDLIAWATEQLTAAAEWVKSTFNKIVEAIEPYKEVICSIGMAILNPSMIPLILAGAAWRIIPDCFKPPIIDLLLGIIIDFLNAAAELPFFGPLWRLLKSGVVGFLEGMRSQTDEVKIEVSNKFAKILSGGSPAFIFGFVKGFLKGVWEGLTDPFKLIYQLITGIPKLIAWFQGTQGEPAAPQATTGNQEGNTATSGGENMQGIQGRMSEMGGELEPDVTTVSSNFMPAVQEQFQGGGGGFTFERLTSMLGNLWASAESAMEGAGTSLANSLCEFMMQDEAEGKLGESIGWLAGTIVFEVVLAILTAGIATAAKGGMKVLQIFLRVLDWTGEVLGVAFRALSRLGGFVIDIVKKLGSFVSDAGGAALRTIRESLGTIGRKLVNFGEELLNRLRRVGDDAASTGTRVGDEVAEEIAEETGERIVREGVEDASGRLAGETTEEAGERIAEEVLEEGAERGGRELGEEAGEKAAELGVALAAARTICETNDAIDTPVPLLIGQLLVLKNRFRWINTFREVPRGVGHYRILMIASEHEVDRDYTATGEFVDEALEDSYQAYVARKTREGKTPRNRGEWRETRDYWLNDSPMARGNAFNRKSVDEQWYPYNEVHLGNGKRLDSYDPVAGEIVSRKSTRLDEISETTYVTYLREMSAKYAPGTPINSRKYKNRLEGVLEGRLILEIPDSNSSLENIDHFIALARQHGVELRYRPE